MAKKVTLGEICNLGREMGGWCHSGSQWLKRYGNLTPKQFIKRFVKSRNISMLERAITNDNMPGISRQLSRVTAPDFGSDDKEIRQKYLDKFTDRRVDAFCKSVERQVIRWRREYALWKREE